MKITLVGTQLADGEKVFEDFTMKFSNLEAYDKWRNEIEANCKDMYGKGFAVKVNPEYHGRYGFKCICLGSSYDWEEWKQI